MNIKINNEIVSFDKEDFPMLISGQPHVGTSFFSVFLMSELVKQGEKVVFFTAFPQAKELFKSQIGDNSNENVLIINSGDENLFLESVDKIKDFSERVVLVKNMENYALKLEAYAKSTLPSCVTNTYLKNSHTG